MSSRIERLSAAIDDRLFDVFRDSLDLAHLLGDYEVFAVYLRLAYGRGYCDALIEDASGERNKLGQPLGYKLPERPVPSEEPHAGT